MKIAILTDIHANLPALKAVLDAIERDEYDLLISLGDIIGIGPFPAECLDLLLNCRKARFVIGNHDEYFVRGLPQTQPEWMNKGEFEHQLWTHNQIDASVRETMAQWPYRLYYDIEGVPTAFVHYPLDASGQQFSQIVETASAEQLDKMFALYSPQTATLHFYGHDHRSSDVTGRARYVNPGSLGCATDPIARYAIVEFEHGKYCIQHRSVAYDDSELLKAFEGRRVPERDFIYNAFFGGRFQRKLDL